MLEDVHLTLKGEIRSSYDGFNKLSELAWRLKGCEYDFINLDMKGTTWFDASMSAAFGAILHKASQELNTITITGIPSAIEAILSKNGFLCNYGRTKKLDSYKTTIEYKRFKITDIKDFDAYVDNYLSRQEIPKMTEEMKRFFKKNLFEVFNNSALHSQTQAGIFSCGQFYPRHKWLDFSIADLGIGIPKHVNATYNLNLPSRDAVRWAIEERNKAGTGARPGGLGFKLIRRLVELNEGLLQVVSDKAYCEISKNGFVGLELARPFPGTNVNIRLNSADSHTYKLSTEETYANII